METALHMALASVSQATRRCYVNHFLEFVTFLQSKCNHADIFPITNTHVVSYLADLFSKNYAPSTMSVKLSAISFIHKICDLPDPCNCFLVKHMLTGAKRLRSKPDARKPILLPDLYKIVDSIEAIQISPYNKCLLQAMYLVAFHAFLRIGEITQHSTQADNHNLTINSIKWELDSVIIHMKTYKHSHNRPVSLRIDQQHQKVNYCPVRALKRYLTLRGAAPGYLFCLSNGKPVSRFQFTNWLQESLMTAGLSSSSFKSHSFRIGAATTAASLGISDDKIRLMGRWHSDSFKKYIRIPTLSFY